METLGKKGDPITRLLLLVNRIIAPLLLVQYIPQPLFFLVLAVFFFFLVFVCIRVTGVAEFVHI